ncbi:hypothetical protein NDU88_005120 [Pleurodeles waltl]|uniref:Myb/SANT-like DNA-binding domain-containing protein n=1 Tax=Pleurodeles waltl TaxID=8319 RepID=A0AAV7RND6_PLEWA|nr:hypothetical protein NDU88_005120 [Pleurodeles waltl]
MLTAANIPQLRQYTATQEELRVMVEEIVRVEPQLFGSQVQQTSIARKMEVWQRVMDRVNAVGQHPRTRDDIRKRWNDLRGKVRSVEPQATPQTQDDQGPGVSGNGHTVQETEAQDNREAGRTAVRQGEDRPREPTLHKALTNILGAYHHSQETMGQILAKLQETQSAPIRKRVFCMPSPKKVRTLGVFDRRSTHCRKRWDDLRRWARKKAEAQLGLAFQRGRDARHTLIPPDVPHPGSWLSRVGWALEGITAATRGGVQIQNHDFAHVKVLPGWGMWAVGAPRPGRKWQGRFHDG